MGTFTFVPVWVIEDILIYIATTMVIFYIVKKEPRPVIALLEMFCFTFLYAAVYENFATVLKLYGYGRSIIMVFNVPLSIPLFEFLVLYCSMKLLEKMQIPIWCKPLLAGFFAVIADFSLDPVAVKQIYTTAEGTIGRWTWFITPNQVQIYSEPVGNFTGWMWMTAFAVLFFLLGRWWYKKSNFSSLVGSIYPVIACLAALLTLFSPITRFVMYAVPLAAQGSPSEWVMLGIVMVVSVLLLAIFWRGRMIGRLSLQEDFPVFFTLGGFPIINLIFCILGGFWQILWLVLLAGVVMWALLGGIYWAGTKVPLLTEKTAQSSQIEPLPITHPSLEA